MTTEIAHKPPEELTEPEIRALRATMSPEGWQEHRERTWSAYMKRLRREATATRRRLEEDEGEEVDRLTPWLSGPLPPLVAIAGFSADPARRARSRERRRRARADHRTGWVVWGQRPARSAPLAHRRANREDRAADVQPTRGRAGGRTQAGVEAGRLGVSIRYLTDRLADAEAKAHAEASRDADASNSEARAVADALARARREREQVESDGEA